LDLSDAIRNQVRSRNITALHRLKQVEDFVKWLKKDLSTITANPDMQVILDSCCRQPEVSQARKDLLIYMQRTSEGLSFGDGLLYRSFVLGTSQRDFDPCVSVLKHHQNRVNCVAYNVDSSLLASASDDRTVAIWNTKTGLVEFVLKGHTDKVTCVAWSPDGQLLVTGKIQHDILELTRSLF
jgi:WD40 repeat protein